jgi:hypothetical protein
MTAWRRQQEVPSTALAEDRKRLVHRYMDAEQEKARRDAIEERERQMRTHEQARPPAARERANLYAVAATLAQPEPAEDIDRQVAAAEERARKQAAEAAAHQIAEAAEQARRTAEKEAALRTAAAVEEALEQDRREAAEEAAREVAAAEERVRREVAEGVSRQVAAAVEEAREQDRRVEAADRAAHQIAVSEQQQATAHNLTADETTPVEAVAELTDGPAPLELAESVEQNSGTAGHEPPGVADAAPPHAVAAVEERAEDNSAEGLPLHKWVQRATRADDESDTPATDWPHALLSDRRSTDSG